MDVNDEQDRIINAIRLIAKMPTIAAMSYKYNIGQPFNHPRNDLNYAENFLYMMFSNPCEEYTINPVFAKAMDRIFMLHADHEQNASTSTVRLAGSTGANPDRKSTRLNSSHVAISYAVFCLKKKNTEDS